MIRFATAKLVSLGAMATGLYHKFGVRKLVEVSADDKWYLNKGFDFCIAAGVLGFWDAFWNIFHILGVLRLRFFMVLHGFFSLACIINCIVVLWKCEYLMQIEGAQGVGLLMSFNLALLCLQIPVSLLVTAIDHNAEKQGGITITLVPRTKDEETGSDDEEEEEGEEDEQEEEETSMLDEEKKDEANSKPKGPSTTESKGGGGVSKENTTTNTKGEPKGNPKVGDAKGFSKI